MADGMDKGLMALMGIEDDTINLQSTNLSCSASGFSSDAVISDMDEDSPTLRQSLSFASPKGPLSTNSRPRQLDLSDVSKSPISKTTSPNPSRSKPLKASSSSLFNRTSSPVDDSSEWHSSAGVLRKRAPSRRSNEKADGPGDFMFSPTLKPKKNIGKPRTPYSAGNTHQDVVPSATRLLSISPPPYPGNLSDRKKSPSSFDMRFCANPLPHDHSDSEVSSFDESISYPSVHDAQRVSLNYSVPSDEALNADLISEFGSGPKSLTLAELVASTSSIGDHKWDRDSDQEDIHEPSMTTKPFRLSKKRDLQETKEREHLLRIGGTNLKSTVNKKLTLQNLMKETLAKQQHKEGKSKFKRNSVSLSSSEDDVNMGGKQDKERRKPETSKAFLGVRIPKASGAGDQALGTTESVNVIASPLSNQIQNLSLLGCSSQGLGSVFTTTPLAAYSPRKNVMSRINHFNSQMKREVSKRNLQSRNILNIDSENSGDRRSLQDHAMEDISKSRKNIRDPIPDETEVGEGMATAFVTEDDEDMDSAHEFEFDEENDADTDSENERSSVESEGFETCDSDRVNGDVQPVKIKRATGRKLNVIGDDDSDFRVVLIDHSQAHRPSKSQRAADDSNDAANYNNRSSDDDDVSDLDELADYPKKPHSSLKSKNAHKTSVQPIEDMESNPDSSTVLSPPTDTAARGVSQASEKESAEVLSGALDFLSGRFPLARTSSEELILAHQDTTHKKSPIIPPAAVPQKEDRSGHDIDQGGGADNKKIPQPVLDTSNQEQTRGRRLVKQDSKRVISKSEKSAFIEYEAEEEEDEFMGMGGVDYESDNPENDDYDLGDDMIDSSTKLGSRDAENVRKLHMQHEQDQHNKEISDLVHGIAAGSLWKRRNGQADDLDLFDEEDMDGRFRRKKKLKISEKLEELADNPTTLAFARAFTKNVDDDRLIFLSDVDETDSERESPQDSTTRSTPVSDRDDIALTLEDDDEEEEILSTDKRRVRLREARLDHIKPRDSTSDSLTAVTRTQVLPFGILTVNPDTKSTTMAADKLAAPMDSLKQVLRRNKVIRSIIDDADDPLMDVKSNDGHSLPFRSGGSSFNNHLPVKDASFLDEHTTTVLESNTTADDSQDTASEATVNRTSISEHEKLVHQSSAFLPKDRRSHFLRTVGDESRQSSRMVKDVNRRRMAFAPAASSESAEPGIDSK